MMGRTSNIQGIYTDVKLNSHKLATINQEIDDLKNTVRKLEIKQAGQSGRDRIISGFVGAASVALINLAASFLIPQRTFTGPQPQPQSLHPEISQPSERVYAVLAYHRDKKDEIETDLTGKDAEYSRLNALNSSRPNQSQRER